MKKRTLVYVFIMHGLGIWFAYWKPIPLIFWIVCLLGILGIWFFSHGMGNEVRGWLLLIAFLCLGAAHYELKNSRQIDLLAKLPLGQEAEIAGKILAGPFTYPNRIIYEIELPNKPRVQLKIKRDNLKGSFEPGDQVMIKGYLDRPRVARNPGEFNYRAYLWQQGLVAEMSVSFQGVTLLELGSNNWQRMLQRAKVRFVENLEDNMSFRASAVARALVFGDKTALEQELRELFLTLGVMHLLAVSGLHVGFLLLLALLIQRLLNLRPGSSFIFTTVLLILYGALTNFTPSVLRASLMALVLFLGGLLRKERDFYTSLATAGLILLLHNPFHLFQSGFQLSFLAAWGIVYFRPLFNFIFPKTLRWREMIMIPLTAQVAVLPATAYYFNLISLTGLFANLLLVPVAGFIVIGGLVAFVASLFSTSLASLILVSLGAAIDLLIQVFTPLGSFSWSAISVGTPSWNIIVLYYLMLIGLKEMILNEVWWEKVKVCRKLIIAISVIVICFMFSWKQYYSRPLEVVFLDVGQGDAIFLRTPKGTTVLLDGGGSPQWHGGDYRVGREIVIPYLQRRGIRQVDLLISSHPDADHLQGLEDVLIELGAQLILLPPQELFGDSYDSLLKIANARQVQIEEIIAGDQMHLDHGITLEVLNPPGYKSVFTTAPDNNHSLLIRVSYGAATFLLTGDIEIEGLERLLKKGEIGPVTIFKAPHHGSGTGYYEPYLNQLEPMAVILSVGRNNYGHPFPELIEYWEKRDVPIYRTDDHGAIMIYTNGKKLSIKGFIAREN